ncbi:hypothetical protein PISMIDRAFT_676090 [Pisolithus microcarpus 441]|uniref:C2H2-type domain-containing protein n=1 Tax=Pisolithus microcarpus 441 TaxID=765257 RepID=A0A0D0A2J7_9AGAM|nr:hypothetical protein PISMIDRAFT_676090 [Pisolithus microcarpus 441]
MTIHPPLLQNLQNDHVVSDSGQLQCYTTSRPSGYMCSACSIPFLSQQSLHQHARMPQADEACRAAVGYHFE